METRGGRNRDHTSRQPPPLSLGLSSVRLIVDRLEANYTRVVAAHKDDRVDQQIVRYDPTVDGDYTDSDFLLKQSSSRVFCRFIVNLGIAFSQCIPRVSYGNFGALAVGAGLVAPRMFTYFVVYPFCRLVFGTLYPAYASYKAVRTKNLKEYVKWMMYWIVFALFTCTETFTDVFLSWFPFYYEVKIVIVLWLLSPATKGSSILYRKFVHPALCRRETEIDEYIAKAKDQGYHTVLNLGTKGVNYATTVIMQTAIKGGGGLVQQIRKSYSLSDLSECDAIDERARDEADDVMCEPQVMRRSVVRSGYNTRRSASESNSRGAMYFPEVDVELRSRSATIEEVDISSIKSSEDISSGYSSADNSGGSLTRTASVGASGKTRARQGRSALTSIKRPQAAEESGVIIEELQDDEQFEFSSLPPLENLSSPLYMSHTNPPFIYQYVGDQVKIIQVLGDPLGLDKKHNPIRDQNVTSQDDANVLNTNVANKRLNDDVEDVFENVADTSEVDNNFEINALKPVETIETKLSTETIKEEKTKFVSDCEKVDNITPVSITIESPKKVDQKDEPIDFKESLETELKTAEIPKNDNTEEKKIDRTIDDDSPASDDEVSFGTPDDSPKVKRKLPKGKYGKGKAPPPPKLDMQEESKEDTQSIDPSITTSQESLLELINALPNLSLNESGSKTSQIVNPIAEIKMRHKSKSPRKSSRSNSSTIGKLLQIPGKLAFWNKGDKTKSEKSLSSGEESRRSSTIERSNDEFDTRLDENLTETSLNISLNLHTDVTISDINIMEKSDDQISFKDASDFETENVVTQDILEKSDVLQKLIDAKIVSHPEYKFFPLKENENETSEKALTLEKTSENQTTEIEEEPKPSKSSDV